MSESSHRFDMSGLDATRWTRARTSLETMNCIHAGEVQAITIGCSPCDHLTFMLAILYRMRVEEECWDIYLRTATRDDMHDRFR